VGIPLKLVAFSWMYVHRSRQIISGGFRILKLGEAGLELTLPLPSPPFRSWPLNSARGSGGALKLPKRGLGRIEIEFGAFIVRI